MTAMFTTEELDRYDELKNKTSRILDAVDAFLTENDITVVEDEDGFQRDLVEMLVFPAWYEEISTEYRSQLQSRIPPDRR